MACGRVRPKRLFTRDEAQIVWELMVCHVVVLAVAAILAARFAPACLPAWPRHARL